MWYVSLGVLLAIATPFATPVAAQESSATVEAAEPVCRGANGYSADFGGARTFLWRPRWITQIETDEDLRADLIEAADEALERGPYSVTHKPRPIPGATPNDYASIGPYWWPDSSKRDGLPYVRRDGEVNPERDGPEFDRDRLRDFAADMRYLSLAWHATQDRRYADHAAMLARAWFLDPATKMNPNLDFAQGIPGRVNGRGEGIIEAADLSSVAEALGLMWQSGALTQAEKQGFADWYGQMAVWLATSENGNDEMAKNNNHGVFYDFTLAHFALFAGAPDVVRNLATNFPQYRLAPQMDRQGRFIEELGRTRSWHYSHFVVEGAARLATIAECVDVDLWGATLPDGRGLATARGFLDRYAAAPGTWPFPDTDLAAARIERMEDRSRQSLLYFDPAIALQSVSDLP